MKHLFLGLAALAAIAIPAHAAEADPAPEGGWAFKSFNQDVDDFDRDKVIDYSYGGVLVHTTDDTVPGVMFTCSQQHGLGAALAVRPINFNTAFEQIDSRSRWRSVTATVGDDEPETGRWLQLPRIGTVEPESHAMRAKLYNAVLLGEPVTIKIAGREAVTITFPPVDADFERWALSCPVTNPAAADLQTGESDLELRTDSKGN